MEEYSKTLMSLMPSELASRLGKIALDADGIRREDVGEFTPGHQIEDLARSFEAKTGEEA